MAISGGRQALRFLGHLWLQSLKRAIWVAVIGVAISGIRLSLSQSGNGSGMIPEDMNSSNMSMPECPRDMPCKKLPPTCLNCNYSDACTYGKNTTVMCTPLEGVQCEVISELMLIEFCLCYTPVVALLYVNIILWAL